MGSRYALREVEGAIGYDCRRLADGRRAVFRHTALHKAARHSILDRKDELSATIASYVAISSLASNPRFEIDAAKDAVKESWSSIVKVAFPYVEARKETGPKSYEDYSAYFDELDAIEAEKATSEQSGTPVREESSVGEQGPK